MYVNNWRAGGRVSRFFVSVPGAVATGLCATSTGHLVPSLRLRVL